jgi:curved DNA-binding protein CbpA
MTDHLGFDPYEVLGIGVDADEIVIQLAYRARIRQAHPDIAGASGLEAAKRLNLARDWLLDPGVRARLATRAAQATGATRDTRDTRTRTARRGAHGAAQQARDPRTWRTRTASRGTRRRPAPDSVDFGPRAAELGAFLQAIGSLTPDERARVNYSLGDTRPVDVEGYRDYLGPELWQRSRALRGAVERAWRRGTDEEAPVVFSLGRLLPTGFLVANAYAQWILLEDFFRDALTDAVFRGEPVLGALAARCRAPWEASVGQARYGPYHQDVWTCLAVAATLPLDAAERLAQSWQQHMGRDARGRPSDHIGPGVWLPAPPNVPEVLKVSGYLAAVDASRVAPSAGLDERHHAAFRFGLRLTAHALALGMGHHRWPEAAHDPMRDPMRDYLRPWREALSTHPSGWPASR